MVSTARQVSRPPTYRSGRVNAVKVARPAVRPWCSRHYFFVSANTNEPGAQCWPQREREETRERREREREELQAILDKHDFAETWSLANSLIVHASRCMATYCKRRLVARLFFGSGLLCRDSTHLIFIGPARETPGETYTTVH